MMKGRDSFVFGVCGPWGCGKSSVLRMVARELESGRSKSKPLVVSFNPWWFSGHDQLLVSFFSQLGAALGRSDSATGITDIGKRLGTLAKVLRPFGWLPGARGIQDASDIVASLGDAAESLGEQLAADVHRVRAEIDEELRRSKRRIVIVIDDIDRLTAEEIAQLFMIVKAVADFPNTVYLLSFDHAVVCQAIRERLHLDGASYLQKIVQIRVDVPSPASTLLEEMFLTRLHDLVSEEPVTAAAQRDFGNLFYGGIKGFFKTPRSVKTLTNLLRVLYPAVAGEVYWPEFVAITALQCFAPDTYHLIQHSHDRFTDQHYHLGRSAEREEEKKFHEEWRSTVPEDIRDYVFEIVRRLFPKVAQAYGGGSYASEFTSLWKAERRVRSVACFSRYFQLQVPAGEISEAEWQQFLVILENSDAVDQRIREWCAVVGPNRKTTQAMEFLGKAGLFAKHGASIEQAKLLLATVLRNGDQLISVEDEDFSTSLSIKNETRIVWAILPLLECLTEGAERERTLEGCFHLAGLRTASKLVLFLGAEHGRFGSEPNRTYEPCHVSSDCVDRVQAVVVAKLQQAAADGTLAKHPRALVLARDWQDFDPGATVRDWVTQASQHDETFTRFLLGVQSRTTSSAIGDHVATIGRSAGADFLLMWFEGKPLRTRCQQILAIESDWLTSEFRAGLQLVVDSIDEEGHALDPVRRTRRSTPDIAEHEPDDTPAEIGHGEIQNEPDEA